MEGPNGLFRAHPDASPRAPNMATKQSTFIRHCFEDPRCYESKALQTQAQLTKHSPGPMYNVREDLEAPSTLFSPRDVGRFPRLEKQRGTPRGSVMYSAGGPKPLSEMRTRPKKKGMSSAHPFTDALFPDRHPDPAKQGTGYLIGHTSSFGKAQDCPGGHLAIQSNFANGCQVRFAPPFDEVNMAGSLAGKEATPRRRREHPSPRLRKVTEIAGNDTHTSPRLPPREKEASWRANKLFPYSNAA